MYFKFITILNCVKNATALQFFEKIGKFCPFLTKAKISVQNHHEPTWNNQFRLEILNGADKKCVAP